MPKQTLTVQRTTPLLPAIKRVSTCLSSPVFESPRRYTAQHHTHTHTHTVNGVSLPGPTRQRFLKVSVEKFLTHTHTARFKSQRGPDGSREEHL